jgi:hypothetical protein
MTNPIDPAFPIHSFPGLTKREYFAVCALQGFLANKAHAGEFHPKHDAKYAISVADALIDAMGET